MRPCSFASIRRPPKGKVRLRPRRPKAGCATCCGKAEHRQSLQRLVVSACFKNAHIRCSRGKSSDNPIEFSGINILTFVAKLHGMGLSLQQLRWPLSLSMSSSFDPDDALAPSASPTAPPDPAEERLFRDLVQEHSARLQRFIIRHIGNTSEAEDLAQQAFTEAARSYRTFRGESQLSTWLYGIALNLIRNYLSRAPERRYDFVGENALDEMAAESVTPEEAAAQAQSMRLLQESLDELPESMRSILLLVGLENLSYEEAAAML